MVDLLLNSLDQLLIKMKITYVLHFFFKTRYLNEEVNRTEPSPSISVPGSVDISS
jgi:hypothetical protein